MLKPYILLLLLAVGLRPAVAAVFYVAPTGNDTNNGTLQQPFLTIQRAQTSVVAGDTVYVRGGLYQMQTAQVGTYFTSGSTSWMYVTNLTKSGAAGRRINYWAYPGEQPVFDYSSITPNVGSTAYRVNAFEVSGSYIHLRGLEIQGVRVPLVATNVNTQSICFNNNRGNNNIYENLRMHDGQAIGFYLTQGVNTLVLNCDAYRNNDYTNAGNTTGTANGGNVDGFGAHPSSAGGTGNVFRGCRAWLNSDDGFDCINAYAAVTFENCWAFYNGYTTNFVTRGDGNGFKAGGYGSTAPASLPATVPNHTVRFCVAVRNRSNGFYANHHLAGDFWNNNTAYQNAINYNMVNRQDKTATGYQVDVDGYGHVLRNNLSLLARSTNAAIRDIAQVNAAQCTIENNTFPGIGTNPLGVSTTDFISLDTTQLRAPRQADGSLPILQTLRLAPSSALIDAGTSAGYPAGFTYSGPAPEVGAYEFAALWTGAQSTDWFANSNWAGGIPTATTDALIPVAGSGQYPLISTGTAVARGLTVSTGASFMQQGGTLSLAGDLANNGIWTATGGTLATSGGATQMLGGSSPLVLQNVSIGSGGAVLGTPISFQGTLTLVGNLTTNGQKLTLLSGASRGVARDGLVVNNGGEVAGTVTVQRAIDASLNGGLGYRHVAAPVSNTTVADLSTSSFGPVVNAAYNTAPNPYTVTPFPTVFGYDEQRLSSASALTSSFDYGWFSPTSTADALLPGRGYTVNLAPQTLDFVGTLNNGPISVPLTRGTTAASGLHLLGNPYPSPIDWDQLARPAGVDNALYVYRSTGQYTGSYVSYVNGIPANQNVLPLGQGFFVRATSAATFTFTNAARLNTASTTPVYRDTRPQLALALRAPAGSDDVLYVYQEAGATTGFDSHYDAVKVQLNGGTQPSLYLVGNAEPLAIQGLPASTRPFDLPLGVHAPTAGAYTFEPQQLANFAPDATLWLEDKLTGRWHDLRTGAYPAALAQGLTTTRFVLHLNAQRPLATQSGQLLGASLQLYPNPSSGRQVQLAASGLPGSAAELRAYNSLGQLVHTETLPLNGRVLERTVELPQLPAGVYSLQLRTTAGALVQKLVLD